MLSTSTRNNRRIDDPLPSERKVVSGRVYVTQPMNEEVICRVNGVLEP